MSSILTNTSAMVALQTLKGVNKNLGMVQNEISTGKSISSAKDNSAVWAISKVMESDVKGFKAISESLSLGESTVAVARNASESVTDLLTQMKAKIVGAQEENVDRAKLQNDITALSDQIASVVGAAQFNGLNLLSGQDEVKVLSSLDRASNGSVSASDITVARADMSYDAGVLGTGTVLTGAGPLTAADADQSGGNVVRLTSGANRDHDDASTQNFSNAANSMTITLATAPSIGDVLELQIGGETVSFTTTTATLNDAAAGLQAAINTAGIEGITATVNAAEITIASTSAFDDITINGSNTGATTFAADVPGAAATGAATSFSGVVLEARASEVEFDASASVQNGDGYRVSIGGANYDYVAGRNETMEDVAKGLKIAIDGAALTNISTKVVQETNGNWTLQIDNDGSALTLAVDGHAGGTATGGLAGLDNIDVTTDEGSEAALSNIETYIDTAIEAAADFGSVQGRIETQADFIGKLSDSLKAGIGSLVDADMEEASARLQALQVQQQLAVQSLSIANQAPQSILSLFR